MLKKTLKKVLNEILGKRLDGVPELIQEAKDLIGPAEDIGALKKELKELQLTKTMEQREIEHLVKLKEEKLDVEHQKKTLVLQGQFQKKEMDLQTEYHGKVMDELKEYNKRQDKFFEQVMERLPNVSAHIGGPQNGKVE